MALARSSDVAAGVRSTASSASTEPDADGLFGLGHAVVAVEADILEVQAVARHSFTTGFFSAPMPSIRISTRSPALSVPPGGVPVAMRSPGSSV